MDRWVIRYALPLTPSHICTPEVLPGVFFFFLLSLPLLLTTVAVHPSIPSRGTRMKTQPFSPPSLPLVEQSGTTRGREARIFFFFPFFFSPSSNDGWSQDGEHRFSPSGFSSFFSPLFFLPWFSGGQRPSTEIRGAIEGLWPFFFSFFFREIQGAGHGYLITISFSGIQNQLSSCLPDHRPPNRFADEVISGDVRANFFLSLPPSPSLFVLLGQTRKMGCYRSVPSAGGTASCIPYISFFFLSPFFPPPSPLLPRSLSGRRATITVGSGIFPFPFFSPPEKRKQPLAPCSHGIENAGFFFPSFDRPTRMAGIRVRNANTFVPYRPQACFRPFFPPSSFPPPSGSGQAWLAGCKGRKGVTFSTRWRPNRGLRSALSLFPFFFFSFPLLPCRALSSAIELSKAWIEADG